MELPKGYLSYSQVALYLKDPNEYFLVYDQKVPQEEVGINAKIGGIFHDVVGDKMSVEEGKAALLALGCMPDKCRALEAAFKDRPEAIARESEETAYLPFGKVKIKLFGIWDGKGRMIIDEYKTTDWWDEFQREFYDALWFFQHRSHPLIRHWKINTNTGKWTLVDQRRLRSTKSAKEKIVFAYKGITNEIWHKV